MYTGVPFACFACKPVQYFVDGWECTQLINRLLQPGEDRRPTGMAEQQVDEQQAERSTSASSLLPREAPTRPSMLSRDTGGMRRGKHWLNTNAGGADSNPRWRGWGRCSAVAWVASRGHAAVLPTYLARALAPSLPALCLQALVAFLYAAFANLQFPFQNVLLQCGPELQAGVGRREGGGKQRGQRETRSPALPLPVCLPLLEDTRLASPPPARPPAGIAAAERHSRLQAAGRHDVCCLCSVRIRHRRQQGPELAADSCKTLRALGRQHAAALEAHQRAAGFTPLLTAAQLQQLGTVLAARHCKWSSWSRRSGWASAMTCTRASPGQPRWRPPAARCTTPWRSPR